MARGFMLHAVPARRMLFNTSFKALFFFSSSPLYSLFPSQREVEVP